MSRRLVIAALAAAASAAAIVPAAAATGHPSNAGSPAGVRSSQPSHQVCVFYTKSTPTGPQEQDVCVDYPGWIPQPGIH